MKISNNTKELARILNEIELECRRLTDTPIDSWMPDEDVLMAERIMNLAKELKWQAYLVRRSFSVNG